MLENRRKNTRELVVGKFKRDHSLLRVTVDTKPSAMGSEGLKPTRGIEPVGGGGGFFVKFNQNLTIRRTT